MDGCMDVSHTQFCLIVSPSTVPACLQQLMHACMLARRDGPAVNCRYTSRIAQLSRARLCTHAFTCLFIDAQAWLTVSVAVGITVQTQQQEEAGAPAAAAGEPSNRSKRSKGSEADAAPTTRSRSGSDNSGESAVVKEHVKPPEAPKPDYIHVRARRGQATDSHSLAERVCVFLHRPTYCTCMPCMHAVSCLVKTGFCCCRPACLVLRLFQLLAI